MIWNSLWILVSLWAAAGHETAQVPLQTPPITEPSGPSQLLENHQRGRELQEHPWKPKEPVGCNIDSGFSSTLETACPVAAFPWETVRSLVPVFWHDQPVDHDDGVGPTLNLAPFQNEEAVPNHAVRSGIPGPWFLERQLGHPLPTAEVRYAHWPYRPGNLLESQDLLESPLTANGNGLQTLPMNGQTGRVCGLLGLVFRDDDFSLVLVCGLHQASPVDCVAQNPTTAGAADLREWIQGHYETEDQLVGGPFNLRTGYRWSQWSLDLQPKLTLGSTRQTVAPVNPLTQETTANDGYFGPDPSGLFGPPANFDLRTQNRLTVVPEMQIEFAIHLSRSLRTFVGYDFLLWSDGARSGDPLSTRAPQTGPQNGPTLPAPLFNDRGFWAQGLTFGLEVRY